MLQVGFEPTIPVYERANTVHALDHAAIVIGFSSPDIVRVIRCMMGRAGHVQFGRKNREPNFTDTRRKEIIRKSYMGRGHVVA
jgi:hypothetical protein